MWSRRRWVLYILVALLLLVCLVRLWSTDKLASSSSPRAGYATSFPQSEERKRRNLAVTAVTLLRSAATQSVDRALNRQKDGSREMAEYDVQLRHKLLNETYAPAERQPVTVREERPSRPG